MGAALANPNSAIPKQNARALMWRGNVMKCGACVITRFGHSLYDVPLATSTFYV